MAQLVFGFSSPRLIDAPTEQDSLRAAMLGVPSSDSVIEEAPVALRETRREARRRRAIDRTTIDSLAPLSPADSALMTDAETAKPTVDSSQMPRPAGKFIDEPIMGKNADSLVYDVRKKLVYIYNQGDVSYQESNLKADYMQIDLRTKLV